MTANTIGYRPVLKIPGALDYYYRHVSSESIWYSIPSSNMFSCFIISSTRRGRGGAVVST